MEKQDEPQREFEHDCDACTFLGRYDGMDLYVCTGANETVIARYGPFGDYMSGLPSIGRAGALNEAAKRAVKRGLLSRDKKADCGRTVGELLDQAEKEKSAK